MSDTPDIPVCIGIILDGNRRWAREHGLTSFEGHRRGIDNLEPIVRAARDIGIQHMIVYAFSTENWDRPKKEISYLMKIFESKVREGLAKFRDEGIAARFVGEIKRLPQTLQDAMDKAEEKNPKRPKLTLWMCISYGGRTEIVQAARAIAEAKEMITEKSLSENMWTRDMPDPDLIIRTGGEQRLSNFLLWQIAYSELFFVEAYWPAFSRADLEIVLKEYATRERRRGK